jgi:hypothetical protein
MANEDDKFLVELTREESRVLRVLLYAGTGLISDPIQLDFLDHLADQLEIAEDKA